MMHGIKDAVEKNGRISYIGFSLSYRRINNIEKGLIKPKKNR